ncbi:MAG: LysE family translocator, partial [Woeseia sp.]
FLHGAATALGVVAGDVVFILAAILGMVAIAESVEVLPVLLHYVGAAYLIWLGIRTLRTGAVSESADPQTSSSIIASFMAGLLLTLADQKAIFFYLVFFPAFIDMSVMTAADIGIVVIIATVAVGGAKLGYAFLSSKAKHWQNRKVDRVIRLVAALIMIAVGLFLLFAP